MSRMDKYDMRGINAYATPNPNGGVNIDVVRMTLDLVTVVKVSGRSKAEFLKHMGAIWDDCEVGIDTQAVRKH